MRKKSKSKSKSKSTKEMAPKEYWLNVMLSCEKDEDVTEDWCMDVQLPKGMTPYQADKIAKDGAVRALKEAGVGVWGETH